MNGLNIGLVLTTKTPGCKWIQLKEEHHVLEQILQNLQKALNKPIRQTLQLNAPTLKKLFPRSEPEIPALKKFDVTKDLIGTFYAKGDWKKKRKHLQKLLESSIKRGVKLSNNSFNSCLIFEEIVGPNEVQRVFKVYNKYISLLMSKSA